MRLANTILHGAPRSQVLFAKTIALALAVASSLSIGKEGPLIHVACCIAYQLTRGANWLCSQTRVDLAALVSFCQQSITTLTWGGVKRLNALVRRARQEASRSLWLPSIPLERWALLSTSDASLANAETMGTQAGNLVALVDRSFLEGKESAWGPIYWRSYRLKRVVPSTLAAESASGLVRCTTTSRMLGVPACSASGCPAASHAAESASRVCGTTGFTRT